ncbi:TRAP transporter large permease subunit, partial [Thalassospira sp.]
MMSATLLILFLALMIIRVPIAVCLGLSSAVVMILFNLPMTVLAQRTVNALDSTPLLAVPLFIFAANLLSLSGVTNHLFELVRMLVGWIRGGTAQVSVLVSLIFS